MCDKYDDESAEIMVADFRKKLPPNFFAISSQTNQAIKEYKVSGQEDRPDLRQSLGFMYACLRGYGENKIPPC